MVDRIPNGMISSQEEPIVITPDTDGNYSLTDRENESKNRELVVGNWLSGHSLICDDADREFTISNNSGFTATITTNGSNPTTVEVKNGTTRKLTSRAGKGISDSTTGHLSGQLIASGSAIFTNSTNNIALTDVGVGVEVGDVIQVSGSTNNDGEFTVEVITDDDNVIVNQAHAGGSTSKSLTDETATVTVNLLAKWYLAPIGLGQGWVDVASNRAINTTYTSPKGRSIEAAISLTMTGEGDPARLEVDGIEVGLVVARSISPYITSQASGNIPSESTYKMDVNASYFDSILHWNELR